jgi:hypothetical protein
VLELAAGDGRATLLRQAVEVTIEAFLLHNQVYLTGHKEKSLLRNLAGVMANPFKKAQKLMLLIRSVANKVIGVCWVTGCLPQSFARVFADRVKMKRMDFVGLI